MPVDDAVGMANAPLVSPKIPTWILILGLGLPTAITWVYFVWLAESPPSVQQTAFGLGKGMQVLLLSFVLYRSMGGNTKEIARSRISDSESSTALKWIVGAGTGLIIGGAIFASYLWMLLPLGVMESVRDVAKIKLAAYGGDSLLGLALIGVFYALFHSGFEELYWRGFVYRGLCGSLPNSIALGLSSLGFMSHHVLVLGKFFGYDSIWTYVCSIGVAIGGVIWGVMYRKLGRLWPAWISHGFVDAALFLIGYHLVFVVGN